MKLTSTSLLKKSLFITCCILIVGCATQIEERPIQSKNPSVPLSSFDNVVLVKSTIADKYAEHPANIKAVNKIDEVLFERLGYTFENLKQVSAEEAIKLQNNSKSTLLIKPLVKQIKFIGGAARFWAGAMAGSSVVIMDVSFVDASSNKVVGETGALRKGNAHAGAWTMGAVDNRMLDNVAQDIVNYVSANR